MRGKRMRCLISDAFACIKWSRHFQSKCTYIHQRRLIYIKYLEGTLCNTPLLPCANPSHTLRENCSEYSSYQNSCTCVNSDMFPFNSRFNFRRILQNSFANGTAEILECGYCPRNTFRKHCSHFLFLGREKIIIFQSILWSN